MGLLAMLYAVTSRTERMNALENAQRNERLALARDHGRIICTRMDEIRADTRTDLTRLETEYKAQRQRMNDAQLADRADLQTKWQNRNAERKTAWPSYRRRGSSNAKARVRPCATLRDQPPPQELRKPQPN